MDLVSGPDVGGGFLFQLTVDASGALGRYVVHVQEGGIDGGEPPVASPATLGFTVASGMCPLGGRACWHREFELDRAEAMRVRFAYNRLRFVIRPMLEQRATGRPVPFQAGVTETVRRLKGSLAAQKIPWVIGGSAAPALLGASLAPLDLDLGTTREGVGAIAEALSEFLIEPAARTRWGTGPPRWAGRAFVGTFQEGLPVEWAEVSAGEEPATASALEWTTEALARPVVAHLGDEELPVVAPEYALVKYLATGRGDRLDPTVALVGRRGPDWDLLGRLLSRVDVPEGRKTSLLERLRASAGR